ncbi:hypothetical protein [Arthrobacter sp. MDT1-65]
MADEPQQATLPAEDQIRETAKWLTVSLAAIGAVVVSGTQFSNIGAVQADSDRFHHILWAAGLVTVGVGIILYHAVRTATSEPINLAEVEADTRADKLARLMGNYDGAKDLANKFSTALDERDTALSNSYANPADQNANVRAKTAMETAQNLGHIVRTVTRMASYEAVAKRWQRAMIFIGIGAALSLAGLMIFIWAINPPKAAAASEASPAVVGEAALRTVTLEPLGQEALATRLGDDCDVTQPLSVLHLDNTDTGPDVVVQQQGCKALRLIITHSWGKVEEPPPPLPDEVEPQETPAS